MPLFARFVRGFVGLLLLSVILSLSCGRRLCVCCVRRFLRFVRLFLTAVCVFQRFCVNWCFSYCLLSFACLDGLFYLICLSLPLITHFLYFFDVFLYALRVACLFFALLAGFCTAWRLVLRNMSFFTVDCAFFLTFFCMLCELLVFFRIFCCGFLSFDAFSPFLPCLSNAKLTGGLGRAGAARKR